MWWVGWPEVDLGVDGRHVRLGETHEKGSTLEGVLGEVLYWGKCIEGKALWKESDNELCQIDGCGCGGWVGQRQILGQWEEPWTWGST